MSGVKLSQLKSRRGFYRGSVSKLYAQKHTIDLTSTNRFTLQNRVSGYKQQLDSLNQEVQNLLFSETDETVFLADLEECEEYENKITAKLFLFQGFEISWFF